MHEKSEVTGEKVDALLDQIKKTIEKVGANDAHDLWVEFCEEKIGGDLGEACDEHYDILPPSNSDKILAQISACHDEMCELQDRMHNLWQRLWANLDDTYRGNQIEMWAFKTKLWKPGQ